MSKSDRSSAVFFLALSIFVCQQSAAIGLGTLRMPGPGLLPFGAAAAIGLLSLGLLAATLVSKPVERRDDEQGVVSTRKFLVISASLFVFVFLVNWLGFVMPTFLFALFLLSQVEERRWRWMVLKALLVTIGNYLVFVVWLKLSLPKGILPW